MAAACASIRAATIGLTTHLPTETWPAMIACVTDLDGTITGVHRTWLDPDGFDRSGSARRRSIRRDGPWAICSAMPSVSAWRRRRARCRRRHRDHAVAALRAADLADGGGTLGQSPRGHAAPADAASALHRPRRRCRRRCAVAGRSVAARRSRRHRGDRPVAAAAATSTRICTSSASTRFGQRCGSSSHRRTSPASCSRRPPSDRRVWLRIDVDSSVAARPMPERPRPRPSRGRSDGRRPGPAMAAARLFSAAAALRRAFASRSKIAAPPPSSAVASALRCAPGAGPSRPPSE